MGPYSLDLRKRIVDAYRNCEGSVRELAERFAVSPTTVQNYLNLARTTSDLSPCPHGGGMPKPPAGTPNPHQKPPAPQKSHE